MNVVIRNSACLLLVFTMLVGVVFGQKKESDRLKNEQKRLEQQIATTKTLLASSKEKTQLSLQEVQLIDQQVKYREQLLNNIDHQIKASDLKIRQKNQNIDQLAYEIEKLKQQYADLLIYAYKKRNKYGELMYIFSANSVEEAIKRKLYLEKLTEIQKKQLRLIQQNMELLEKEIVQLDEQKKIKLALADQKRKERADILVAKKEKEEIYKKLKGQEEEMLAELKKQELQQKRLDDEIQAAIQREIREEQERIRKEEERLRKIEEAKRLARERDGVADVATPDEASSPSPFMPTKEAELIGRNFSSNRGRLPWPVENGSVSKDFGRHPHPFLEGIFTDNNGIDISTPKNAVVRAVFDGEVTSVISIPGAGKVIIVKHGNYRTVYSNIQDVYVTKGTAVTTKMAIGSLLPTTDGSISVAHFEIHEVSGTTVKKLNPNLWIVK